MSDEKTPEGEAQTKSSFPDWKKIGSTFGITSIQDLVLKFLAGSSALAATFWTAVYANPAILALDVTAGAEPYICWVISQSKSEPS